MLSKKRALKKLKKEIIRNAIVISKFSFLQTLSFLSPFVWEQKLSYPQKRKKKKHPRTLCYTKNIQQKAASAAAAASIGNVERYNKTTQHAFTTFIGSEI